MRAFDIVRSRRFSSVVRLCLAACLFAVTAVFFVPLPGSAQEGETAAHPEMTPDMETFPKDDRTWKPLEDDGLHDPDNPSLEFLQQPSEALGALPFAFQGNQVDWAAALREGAINPRTNVFPETKVNVLDLDVLMKNTAGMPQVNFPHKQHTEWLDCQNCHDHIFKKGRGSNNLNMMMVLSGYYCGQCHGAVSFPLTQCTRCHSVAREVKQ